MAIVNRKSAARVDSEGRHMPLVLLITCTAGFPEGVGGGEEIMSGPAWE